MGRYAQQFTCVFAMVLYVSGLVVNELRFTLALKPRLLPIQMIPEHLKINQMTGPYFDISFQCS